MNATAKSKGNKNKLSRFSPAHNKHEFEIAQLAKVAYAIGFLYILHLAGNKVIINAHGVINLDIAKGFAEVSYVSLFSFLTAVLVFLCILVIGYWIWEDLT